MLYKTSLITKLEIIPAESHLLLEGSSVVLQEYAGKQYLQQQSFALKITVFQPRIASCIH